MAMDWLNAPIEKSIGDLVARRRYGKAIEELRAQIVERGASTQARLQLADLLVLAGRGREAAPILFGLADEFAADGFAAKAVAVLKRVEKIEPGRADVESRLSALVRVTRPSAPAPRAALPEFGIEEIGHEPVATEPSASPTEPLPTATEPPPAAPEPLPVSEPAPEPSATIEPVPATESAPEASPAPRDPDALSAEPAPSAEGTHRRIRGVFRRFLASIGRGGEKEEGAETQAEQAPDVEAAPPAEPVAATGPPVEPIAPAVPAEPAVEVSAEPSVPAADAQTGQPVAGEPPSAPEQELPEPPVPHGAAEDYSAEGEGLAEGEGPGVTGRIKGAFRRLFTSIAGVPADGEAGETAPAAPGGEQTPSDQPPLVEETGAPSAAAEAAPEPVPTVEPAEIPPAAEAADAADSMSEEAFQEKVLDMIEGVLLHPPPPETPPAAAVEAGLQDVAYAGPILASPLFDDLSGDELLAVVHGLQLQTFEAGDVIVTEGEPGESLYIITTGTVKVFVRNPAGRDLEVGRLGEGDFFGEISSLSGRPRTATVTAASRCELLELGRATVDSVARAHPHVREILEAHYIARANSPEAAAIRAVPLDTRSKQHAVEVLEAHFGENRFEPRVRLRLADALLKAGNEEDAIAVMIGLADDLAREGYTEKAIAVLKKIERVQRRHMEEINLAPLKKGKARAAAAEPRPQPAPPPGPEVPAPMPGHRPPWAGATEESFRGWIVDILRERLQQAGAPAEPVAPGPWSDPSRVSGYARSLKASPLFEGLSDEELLAVIKGLRLHTVEPGDILVTEGEPGESLFVLAVGAVKVFVRNPSGRNFRLCALREGSFFGEMSTLSSRPRSATVTAASACDLLELEKAALETIAAAHPRVRTVLEEFYIERASSPDAASIRGMGASDAGTPAPS